MTWPIQIWEEHPADVEQSDLIERDEANEREIYQRDLRTSWLDPNPIAVDPENKS